MKKKATRPPRHSSCRSDGELDLSYFKPEEREVARLEQRVAAAESNLELTRTALRVLNQINEELKREVTRLWEARRLRGDIDDAMLMKLIRLAHPDLHGGSELSHEVTRWLLERRRRR